MTAREMIRLLCTQHAGNRARLAFSPPGTWQRSPQNGLVRAARKRPG